MDIRQLAIIVMVLVVLAAGCSNGDVNVEELVADAVATVESASSDREASLLQTIEARDQPTATPEAEARDQPTATAADVPFFTENAVVGLVQNGAPTDPLLQQYAARKDVSHAACQGLTMTNGMPSVALFDATYDGQGRWTVKAECLDIEPNPVFVGEWLFIEETREAIGSY